MPFESLREAGFDLEARNYAEADPSIEFPDAASELTKALLAVRIPAAELIGSGGSEAASTQRMRNGMEISCCWHLLRSPAIASTPFEC
jgi:hypothetical protein